MYRYALYDVVLAAAGGYLVCFGLRSSPVSAVDLALGCAFLVFAILPRRR